MPHDKNGNLLIVGDEVTLRGKVTSVAEGTDTCNLSIATATSTLTINAKDTEKVAVAEAAASDQADGGGTAEEKPDEGSGDGA